MLCGLEEGLLRNEFRWAAHCPRPRCLVGIEGHFSQLHSEAQAPNFGAREKIYQSPADSSSLVMEDVQLDHRDIYD